MEYEMIDQPEFESDPTPEQQPEIGDTQFLKNRIAIGVLRALAVIGIFAAVAGSINDYLNGIYFTIPGYWIAYGIILFIAFWKGTTYRVRAWTIPLLFYFIGLIDLLSDGGVGYGKAFLVIFPLATALFLGRREGITAVGVTMLTMASAAVLFTTGRLSAPPVDPTNPSGWISGTAIYLLLTSFSVISINYLVPQLTESLNQSQELAEDLKAEREGLEIQVQERTQELERRRIQLETAAQIARDTAEIQQVQVLLNQAVTLISNRFGFYHAGIFLIDSRNEYAVLRAASSSGGKQMLARNHQLAVGIEGIVGYVTGSGEPRVALDVGADATFFNNPDLPETRSEMALPLRARGEIIGALDVQSKQAEAFSEDDVEILQTMADQLAVAITNARLFEQAQSALEATRQAYGELSQEAWSERLSRRKNFGYFCDEKGVTPLDQGQFTPSEEENGVAIPLTIRGKTIGTLMAYKARENAHWSSEEVNFIDTLTERMGDALESARLFQDTQKRAIREQLTSQVSAQFRRSLDMETVLKTAAEEIRKALDLEDTIVQLVSPEDTLDMETSQPHPGDDHA